MTRFLLFCIVLLFTITSCGDDDPECNVETIVGTYMGTQECVLSDPDALDMLPPPNVTFNITQLEEEDTYGVMEEGADTGFVIQVDGCEVTVFEVGCCEVRVFEVDTLFLSTIRISGDGEFIGDDQLLLNVSTGLDDSTAQCEYDLIRQ